MKKYLLLSLCLLLGLGAFAQRSSDRVSLIEMKSGNKSYSERSDGKVVKVDGNKCTYLKYGNDQVLKLGAVQSEEVMYTTYDLQSNGQVANRMYHREDGSVAVVAMMSHDYDQSASDRGTAYNFFDGNSWGDYPYERAKANATGYDMRTGWPSIAPYGENGEILVNHSDGLNYYIRETAGEGLWDGPYSIPNMDYSYSLSWPRVVTSGDNNEIVHVFSAAYGNDGETAQFYSRFDGEEWTTQWSPLYNTNEHIGIYSADEYCVSANGNVVAVVYAAPFYGDVLMYKSTDNGLTWTKYVVWENPYKGDWETDEETITGGENDPAAQTPTMSTVAVGPDGVVHVAFSVANYVHSELGTTFSYYHGRAADGIAYWNDRREPLGNLSIWNPDPENEGYLIHSNDNINFCGWMPFYENIGGFDDNMIYSENDYIYTFYGACSGYPALSVDPDGNLALAYSTIDMRRNNGSHYYRSVFVSYKAAENEGWNVAVEELTEDFLFTYTEALSVSSASVSAKENEFWFSFLGDDTHGFYQGADASQSSASDNYVYVSKFVLGEYGDDNENDDNDDDENDDNDDDITQAYRNVLIETFTGRNESYSPSAHRIANVLAAANPGRVFPVNIHCGSFSPTSSPNMNTTDGTEIMNAFNVSAFPCGNINRNSGSAIGRGEWSTETYNQLSQMAEVNVSGLVKINPFDRVAEITVDLDYISNSNYNTNYLTVMMLQDSIWGSQSGGSSNPEQYVNGQYCHMHVLRNIITPTWGDAVSPTTAGTHITKTYTYEIPEIIGNPNGVEVDLDNIYFLAFVTENYQGTPTRPILNVDKLVYVYGTNEAIYPYISTIALDSETLCSSIKTLNVNLINLGLDKITSLGFEIYIDGYFEMEQVWQGNIPSYQSSNILMDVEIPVGTHDVEIKIVEANGVPFETSKSIDVNVEEGIDTYVNGNSGEYTVDVMTNGYGGTISWEIIASDNSVLASDEFSNNGTYLNTETVTIPAGECVRFIIRNSNNNNFNSGYYRIFDGKGNVVVYNEGNFEYEQSYMLSVISDDNMDDSYAENTFNVNVDVPGTLLYKLVTMIEHWSDVYVLKVNGELNSADLEAFSKLTHLMTLDLTETNISTISGLGNLQYLRNVYLPATVTNVNNQAFYNCKSLYSIDLPNATTIGDLAFYNCYSLASINIPNVTSIDYDAFYYCQSLTSIDISNATDLSNNSNYGIFYYCTNLSEVILSDELTYIPYECFYYCTSLQEINLPASLKTIDGYAFYGCALTDINIPEGVTSIGDYAFSGCPTTTISIPSSITSIGSNVFSNGNITDVYCYAATPVTTSTFNGGLSYATLHVPEFSVVAYKVHDSWYKFNIVALDELLSDVYINSDYTIVDYNGLADEVNLTLDLNAHLTVTAGSEFVLNNYKQITSNTEYYEYDDYNWNYYYYYPSTLITYNEMNADNVEVSLVLRTDRWNFISLPFDVNVSDITYPEGTLWVVRKYSGEDRANMTGNTWHNMTDGMTLNAGEGYILHCDHANNSYVTFTFPAVNNESMNNMFAYQDFEQHLEIYPSEFAHNRSWNLVGNPYPSYFNTNGNIEHNGIITVWDNAYVAYSLLDDYFTLKPYESFFVQCPDDATSMLFKTEGRSHTNDYDDYSKRDEAFRQRNSGDRKIYNFTLNNEEYSDRTRLVLNEAASVDYELSCDASKFMNEDENVPQIYVYDSEVLYAINERPLFDGLMSVGIRIGQTGEYTLTLDPKEEYNEKVVLYDNETGEEIDILNGSYTFFAEEGYDDDRFVLSVTGNTIGIEENVVLDINDPDVEVYDIYGRKVRVSDAKNGLYILRKGDMVQRYFISE